MNHLDLFNLPDSYSLDFKDLDKEYFALQVQYHPDKARNPEERRKFLQKAIDINDGYKTLQNDYTRAVYFLKLRNIYVENEYAKYPLPPEVLQQIWNDREELEGIEDLRPFLASKIENKKNLLTELAAAFDIANYEKAAILTVMLKYLDNLIAVAKEK